MAVTPAVMPCKQKWNGGSRRSQAKTQRVRERPVHWILKRVYIQSSMAIEERLQDSHHEKCRSLVQASGIAGW
ncbi:hypothetical protein [Chromobacterium vaccinii]|uniref:hypothetical protein n=1 Tax=Chromobacterium vaccinii TaxID=1108595 RepID=UPI0011863EFC|nr:hypothetical protein [Chromobacterium vaccinii]